MRFRSKMRRRTSRKVFTKYAKRSHKRNFGATPMRGGFRI